MVGQHLEMQSQYEQAVQAALHPETTVNEAAFTGKSYAWERAWDS